jgi:hypothetical protein
MISERWGFDGLTALAHPAANLWIELRNPPAVLPCQLPFSGIQLLCQLPCPSMTNSAPPPSVPRLPPLTPPHPAALSARSAGKWARGPWAGSDAQETQIKEETQATLRCFPFDQPEGPKTCFFTGQPATEVAIFSKSY